MAFFSNGYAYDTQLRRKRSTSTNREKPTDETCSRRRSPSVSVASSPHVSGSTPEPPEPLPPLPTPVSAGLGRSRTPAMPADKLEGSTSPYDQSSTPIPFTKPGTKRTSPPPFSNLMINVPGEPTMAGVSPAKHTEKRSSSKTRVGASTSASSSPRRSPRASGERPKSISIQRSPQDPSFLDISPPQTAPQSPALSPVKTSTDVESRPPSSLPYALASPKPTKSQPVTASLTLPTPVSPPQHRTMNQPEFNTTPFGHSRSRSQSQVISNSNSPAPSAPASAPTSAKSSARRVPVPAYDRDVSPHLNLRSPPASGSRSGSASGSGNSTPTRDGVNASETGKQREREKRPRNVLRKSSTARPREPASTSAYASDGERKTHQPRARSGVFSSSTRRNSSGALFDLLPLPLAGKSASPKSAGSPKSAAEPDTGNTIDLTPAGEILVAYKESQRERFARESSFGSSGRIVAVGSPEDDAVGAMRSPWTPGWRSVKSGEDYSADERDRMETTIVHVGGLRRSLSRKFSGRWAGKEAEGARRSTSRAVVEVSPQRERREGVGKRSATFPKDPTPNASPTGGRQPGGWSADEEKGRVWEEDVGDWVAVQPGTHGKEDSDGTSPSRLWKLVKRFSSGNLKEKHSPPLVAPPPVPPLPREVTRGWTAAGDAEDADADGAEMPIPQTAVPETAGGIMRYITSVPALSIPSRTKETKQSGVHRRPDPGAQGRRSTTTRSSSPGSETTKFFSRSRTSSSSSYGEEVVPPMPHAQIGRHILPPSELYRIHNSKSEGDEKGGDTQPSSGSSSITRKPSPSSPEHVSPAGSATIPIFEAQDPVNSFSPYRGKSQAPMPPTSHFPDPEPLAPRVEKTRLGAPPPPPIPQRSPRRPSASAPSLSLPVRQHSMPGAIPIQDVSESEVTDPDVSHTPRWHDSGRTPMAPKARPRSISDGAADPGAKSPSTARSTLTFREMTKTQRQLTEQEKNAKWEDLLQRSDMAGGTLHVGSPTASGLGLWSDRSSMALSETLDRF